MLNEFSKTEEFFNKLLLTYTDDYDLLYNGKDIKQNLKSNNVGYFYPKNDIIYDTTKINKELYNQIVELANNIKNNEWKKCEDVCKKVLTDYISRETNSTAYYLRCLAQGLMSTNKNYQKLQFNSSIEKLSGDWNTDKNNIKILIPSNSQSRLVLGLGPSASGKTYCAKTMLKLFDSYYDGNFPKEFLSVDGGIYRDASIIYKMIVQITKSFNDLGGIENLAGESIFDKVTKIVSNGGMMFDTGSIKSSIIKYLIEQKRPFSLYVPETLVGKCSNIKMSPDCDLIKNLVEISGDKNYISLCIFQHESGGANCPYPNIFKCIGCKESGTSRQKSEGKIYSSSGWKSGIKLGIYYTLLGPGPKFIIHNSGRPNANGLIIDVGNIPDDKFKQKILDLGLQFKYVNNYVKMEEKSGLLKKIFTNPIQNIDEIVSHILNPIIVVSGNDVNFAEKKTGGYYKYMKYVNKNNNLQN